MAYGHDNPYSAPTQYLDYHELGEVMDDFEKFGCGECLRKRKSP